MSAEPRGFVYEPARGPKRKIEFRETDNGFVRVESVWTGCRWPGSTSISDDVRPWPTSNSVVARPVGSSSLWLPVVSPGWSSL